MIDVINGSAVENDYLTDTTKSEGVCYGKKGESYVPVIILKVKDLSKKDRKPQLKETKLNETNN